MVLQDLYKNHRWTIKDLIHAYVTMDTTKPNTLSKKICQKRLIEALDQEDLLEVLFNPLSGLNESAQPFLIYNLYQEVEALGNQDIGLGEFNSNKTVYELDLLSLLSHIHNTAPWLCSWIH
jgi:hypothetical protein